MHSVTALITTYNRSAALKLALDSVLGQTRAVDELVVVDDGSTDDTQEVLKTYGSRLIVVRQDNAGQTAALNAGLAKAGSDYIAILDDDDTWQPQKIERQMALIEAEESVDVVFSTLRYIGGDPEATWPKALPTQITTIQANVGFPALLCGGEVYEALLPANFIPHGSALIRKQALEEVGGYAQAEYGNDFDLWLSMAREGKTFAFIKEPLLNYAVHQTNMSKDSNAALSAKIAIYRRNLQKVSPSHSAWRYLTSVFSNQCRAKAGLEFMKGNAIVARNLYKESLSHKLSARAVIGYGCTYLGGLGRAMTRLIPGMPLDLVDQP